MTSGSPPMEAPRRSRWLLVPPPPLFVFAFMAGAQFGRVLPMSLVSPGIYPYARGLGFVALVAAGLLLVSAPALFLLHRTTIIPHGNAQRLVTGGPFRFTRNPMYLALTTAYLGLALVVNVLWVLPLFALPLWVLQTKVIPFEEQNLGRLFGEEYRTYQQRVRRWL